MAVLLDDSTDWLVCLGLWLGVLDVASRLNGQHLFASRWMAWSPLAGLAVAMTIHHTGNPPHKKSSKKHAPDTVLQVVKFLSLLPLLDCSSFVFPLELVFGLIAALAVLVGAVRVCCTCTIKRPLDFVLDALRLTGMWLSVLVVSALHGYRPNAFPFWFLYASVCLTKIQMLASVVALLLVGSWFLWRHLGHDSFKSTAPACTLLLLLALAITTQYHMLVQRMHAQINVWQIPEFGWSVHLNESVTLVASPQDFFDEDLIFEARVGLPSVVALPPGEPLTVAEWSKREQGPEEPDVVLLRHSDNPCLLAHSAQLAFPRLLAMLFSAAVPPRVDNSAPPEYAARLELGDDWVRFRLLQQQAARGHGWSADCQLCRNRPGHEPACFTFPSGSWFVVTQGVYEWLRLRADARLSLQRHPDLAHHRWRSGWIVCAVALAFQVVLFDLVLVETTYLIGCLDA